MAYTAEYETVTTDAGTPWERIIQVETLTSIAAHLADGDCECGRGQILQGNGTPECCADCYAEIIQN